MKEMLLEENALEQMVLYFTQLAYTGYVKQSTNAKYLLFAFLVDFSDTVYDYLSEEDKIELDALLSSLFSSNDCLLRHRIFGDSPLSFLRYNTPRSEMDYPRRKGYASLPSE